MSMKKKRFLYAFRYNMKERKDYLMNEEERLEVWNIMVAAGFKVRRKHIQKIVNKRQPLCYVCPLQDKMVLYTPSVGSVVAITL